MFGAKLETAAMNYEANKRVEQAEYVNAAAGLSYALNCDEEWTDYCTETFPADVMGWEMCMSDCPGCMDGIFEIDMGDLQAQYAAIETVYGGIDQVTAPQWNDLA